MAVTLMCFNTHSSKFDMDYYMDSHFDLVGKLWRPICLSAQAIKGIATSDPDTTPHHEVLAILKLENIEELQSFIADHNSEVMGDIYNFTDAAPTIQISANLG